MGATIARTFVHALARVYRISKEGDELVPLLGKGSENDNLSALETWVNRQLLTPPEELVLPIFNNIIDRFESILRGSKGGRQ